MKVLFYLYHERYLDLISPLINILNCDIHIRDTNKFIGEKGDYKIGSIHLRSKPDVVICMHIWRPEEQIFLKLCKKRGIKTVLFEHGSTLAYWSRQKYKSNLPNVDISFHWCNESKYIYKSINKKGCNKFETVGVPSFDFIKKEKIPNKSLCICTTHSLQLDIIYKHVLEAVSFAERNKDWKIFIQRHPVEHIKKIDNIYLTKFISMKKPENIIIGNGIGKAKYVVSHISSVMIPFCLSGANIGTPTINIKKSNLLKFLNKIDLPKPSMPYSEDNFSSWKMNNFLEKIGYPIESSCELFKYKLYDYVENEIE